MEKNNFEPFVILPLISTKPSIKMPVAAKMYSQLFRVLMYFIKAGMTRAITRDIATIVNWRMERVRDILVKITKLVDKRSAM